MIILTSFPDEQRIRSPVANPRISFSKQHPRHLGYVHATAVTIKWIRRETMNASRCVQTSIPTGYLRIAPTYRQIQNCTRVHAYVYRG